MTQADEPMHLATLWEGIAARIPDAPALIHGSTSRTWREFDDRASRLGAALLDAGVGPGTKVAIDLYNCSEWLEAFFAAIKIRAVPANVNYRYLDDELRHLLTDSEAEAIIFHSALAERVLRLRGQVPGLETFVQVEQHGEPELPTEQGTERYEELIRTHEPTPAIKRSQDDQFLSYTGGTTGLPKGVMVNLARATGSLAFLGPMFGLTDDDIADPVGTAGRLAEEGRQLVAIPASPLMHSTGFQMTALPTLVYGGAVVTLTSRSLNPRELLESVAKHRVRLTSIVGDAIGRPVLRELQDAAAEGRHYDLSSLGLIASAGVAWTAETKDGLFEFMPHVTMLDGCGTTEGCTYGFRTYRKGDPTSGTNFMPADGLQVIGEDGVARPPAPGLMGILAAKTSAEGYYNDPEKTARTYREINGEWSVVPGDYGRIEADGSLTLLGRGSTTINTGGEKVHPEEVEDIIKNLAGVDDCLVFGIPNDRWGQRVTAVVQLREGATLDPAEIIESTRAHLAAYKAPKEVLLVERVPRGPNGKPDYAAAKGIATERGAGQTA